MQFDSRESDQSRLVDALNYIINMAAGMGQPETKLSLIQQRARQALATHSVPVVTDEMVGDAASILWRMLDLNGHTVDGVKRAARAALEAALSRPSVAPTPILDNKLANEGVDNYINALEVSLSRPSGEPAPTPDPEAGKGGDEPVGYQWLRDGKWVECSEFVAKGWSNELSKDCRAIYARPQSPTPAPTPASDELEVKRFELIEGWGTEPAHMEEDEHGEFVQYEDYTTATRELAEARAEIERLRNALLRERTAIIHTKRGQLGALASRAEAAEARIAELEAEKAATVKALEWTQKAPPGQEHEPFVYYALGIGGHYRAERDGLLWFADDEFTWEQFPSQNEAKAAAQADYERRILSALTPQAPEGK